MKIALLLGAYFLALLETWIELLLHTRSLSVQEPRGRISSGKCQDSVIFFSLSSCRATKYPGKRFKFNTHLIFFFLFSLSSTWVKITISCSWKMGGNPNFLSLFQLCGLFWTLPWPSAAPTWSLWTSWGVWCDWYFLLRWDSWESTEKEGEILIYGTVYVSELHKN